MLIDANYAVAIDPAQPREPRLAAFAERMDWNAPLKGTTTAGQMDRMVAIFGSMGLLEVRPGVEDDPDLPPTMMVASFGPHVASPPPASAPAAAAPVGLEQARAALRSRTLRESGGAAEEPSERPPLPVRYPGPR